MAKDLNEERKRIKSLLTDFENQRVKEESKSKEMKKTRRLIKETRENLEVTKKEAYLLPEAGWGRPLLVYTKGEEKANIYHPTAHVTDSSLGYAKNKRSNTQKLVIADDYAKQGRIKESYALLGNILDTYRPKNGDEAYKIYKAVERRALRYAERVLEHNPELAKELIKISEAASRYANKSL